MDIEIVKGFLQLGGMGVLGLIFFFASRASDKRLDMMLLNSKQEREAWHSDARKERELWRQTIDTLSGNIIENTNGVERLDCNFLQKKSKR